MDLETIEKALDSGNVEVQMNSGRWWAARRNGKTKTWKKHPGDFRIPIKAGLRSCGEITHTSVEGHTFRIKKERK